jgi:flagellar protein FlgJ
VSSFFEEMHDQQLATELSGKGSMGLADLIVQQLSPNSKGYKPASILRGDAELTTDKILGKIKPLETKESSANSTVSASKEDAPSSMFESPAAFVQGIWEHAKAAANKIGLDPEVMIAQAALETGWGKHVIKK